MSKKTSAGQLFLICFFISLFGLLFAGYALHSYYATQAGVGDSLFCNIGASFDCSAVSRSAWSEVFGIPLALLGFAFFLFLAMSFLLLRIRKDSLSEELAVHIQSFYFVVVSAGLVFSLFLLGISIFQIGKLCLSCLAMDLAQILLVVVLARGGVWKNFTLGLRQLLRVPLQAAGLGSDLPAGIQRQSLGVVLIFLLSFGASFVFGEDLFGIAQRTSQRNFHAEASLEEARLAWLSAAPDDIPAIVQEGAQKDFTQGPDDAPIRIFEIFDYACGYCRMLAREMKILLEKYPGKIQLRVADFPLDPSCNPAIPASGHASSCMLAEYVRCAGEQGKYWELYDMVFALPELDRDAKPAQVETALRKRLAQAEIDEEALDECLASDRQMKSIQDDIVLGRSFNIPGTPSVWINNHKLQRADPRVIEHIIQSLLAREQQ